MLHDRFEILFVCHANLCRSPLAERLTRWVIDDLFGTQAAQVQVSSAGTHAFAGSPMHPGSAQVLGEWGVDAAGFASRPISAPMLAGADLILAAGREQRAACVTLAPTTVRRTFTVRQFVRFAAAIPQLAVDAQSPLVERLAALVEQVNASRHLVLPVPAAEDDLPDPVAQPIAAFRDCATELQRGIRVVTDVIARS